MNIVELRTSNMRSQNKHWTNKATLWQIVLAIYINEILTTRLYKNN